MTFLPPEAQFNARIFHDPRGLCSRRIERARLLILLEDFPSPKAVTLASPYLSHPRFLYIYIYLSNESLSLAGSACDIFFFFFSSYLISRQPKRNNDTPANIKINFPISFRTSKFNVFLLLLTRHRQSRCTIFPNKKKKKKRETLFLSFDRCSARYSPLEQIEPEEQDIIFRVCTLGDQRRDARGVFYFCLPGPGGFRPFLISD